MAPACSDRAAGLSADPVIPCAASQRAAATDAFQLGTPDSASASFTVDFLSQKDREAHRSSNALLANRAQAQDRSSRSGREQSAARFPTPSCGRTSAREERSFLPTRPP